MSDVVRAVRGRDWLGELRSAEGDEAFAELVAQIAEAAPHLRDEVLSVAQGFGEDLAAWAMGLFILPAAQSKGESPKVVDPVVAEAMAQVRAAIARRKAKAGTAVPKPAVEPEDEPPPEPQRVEPQAEPEQEEPLREAAKNEAPKGLQWAAEEAAEPEVLSVAGSARHGTKVREGSLLWSSGPVRAPLARWVVEV